MNLKKSFRVNKINSKGKLDGKSLLIVILTVATLCISVLNVSASISPPLVEMDLEAGEEYTFTTNVTIPGILQKVDVVFAFDLTFSMEKYDILSTAKNETEQIMNTLITSYPGVNFTFGVMSHMDYPDFYSSCGYSAPYGTSGDYAYSLDQPLTNDPTAVNTTINGLSLGSDGSADAPEDYTRIFYESYNDSTNIGWRTDATKLLVNFGDNVPHDCNLKEGVTSGTWSTGNDPGPDEDMSTQEDNLDLQSVLATMNSSNITLIEGHTTFANNNYWTYWTGITGGSVHIISSSNFVDKVINAITGELTNLKVYDLQLKVTTQGYEDWLTLVDPSSYAEVPKGTSVIFNETICVPEGTPSGFHEFNVSAVDADGVNYGNQTNKINVNEPPTANDDSVITKEDTSIWINVTANDTDSDGTLDLSTVNITDGPYDGIATINTTTGEIQYTPDTNFYGTDSFTYTVDDDDGATSNTATVTIIVGGVNDPPVITTEDDATAVEDELYSVDYDATDNDLDILTWSLVTNAGFLSIDPDTGVLSGTPENSHVGSYYVNVSVDDGNGGSDFSNFTLVVSNVNDPPNAPSNPNPGNGNTGVDLSPVLSVNVSDPDGDILNVSFYDGSDNLIGIDIGVASGDIASVSWSSLSYLSMYSWYAVANDSEFENKSDTWSFTTKKKQSQDRSNGKNNPPIADASASETFGFLEEMINFDGSLSSDDGHIINFTWDFGDGATGYGETTTHNYSDIGTYTVTLTVTDDDDKKDTDEVTVTIAIANSPITIITTEGTTTGDVNKEYTYTVNSTDSDSNDTVIYTFDWGDETNTISSVLSRNTSFNTTHSWSKYGIYTVTITAEDGIGSQDSETITVYIDVLPIDGEIRGYLVDEDSDDTYDSFNNTDTGEQTDVEKENNTYLIDSSGNNKWDYAYNPETGLSTYYEYVYQKYYNIYQQSTPGFELVFLLATMALVLIIMRRRR